jgi:hypothetical protein
METKTFEPRTKRPTISWEDAVRLYNEQLNNN